MRFAFIQRLTREILPLCVVSGAVFLSSLGARYAVKSWRGFHEKRARVVYYKNEIFKDDAPSYLAETITREHEALERKIDTLTLGLIESDDLSGLVELLFHKADSVGIDGAPEMDPQDRIVTEDYIVYPIRLALSAPFPEITAYIASLESIPHIVKVKRIAVTASTRGLIDTKLLIHCLFSRTDA